MKDGKCVIRVEIRINPRLNDIVDNSERSLTIGTRTYTFDRIHLTTSQTQLYDKSVRHLTESFIEGYDCTVIAYGQTGSGKTYTMGITHEDTTGIVPQALKHIFNKCSDVSCSFIEIYNEEVFDLLGKYKIPLDLREIHGEISIPGMSEVQLKTFEEGMIALRRGCLERTTKSTNMNSKSSRSHAIFTLFYKNERDGAYLISKFSFVDLAGSERLKRTLCAGDCAKESISINSGLLALGNVISALFMKLQHVPFRDSKLTRILQNCLNGYILIIACISSSHADIGETHNTLKYASRAACIETKAEMNIQFDSSKFKTLLLRKEIQKLKVENQMLKERLRRSGRMDTEELVSENRILKSKIETSNIWRDDRREDLAQEILKSPFVQNLMDENQRLGEEIKKLRPDTCEDDAKKGIGSACYDKRPLDDCTPFYEDVNFCNRESERKENITESKPTLDDGFRTGRTNINPDMEGTLQKNSVTMIENAKMLDRKKLIEKDSMGKFTDTHKKVVTFELEKNSKKYALFTPRKEKIVLSTMIQGRLTGYVPTVLALFGSSVIFASTDNKVRRWGEDVDVLFCEDGVRCLESTEMLLYTTRGILKSFDYRSGVRPLYAFKSEISALIARENNIFVGHEDGSFSVLDNRCNSILFSARIHSGTIFCIEKVGEYVYTGSRDHTVKCYLPSGVVSLSPPHLDSVQGLLGYKGDLISLGRDCSLKRWRNGSIVKTVPYAHDSWIRCGAVMSDSFVTGSKNGTLRFWDFCDNSVFCVGKLKLGGCINSTVCDGFNTYAGCQNKEIIAIKCEYKG